MKYLAVRHIVQLHQRIMESTGGDSTILDTGKIESTHCPPRMTFEGRSLDPTLADKAAALAYSLNRNHAFRDGNKRISHAALEMFLVRNGHELDASMDGQEAIFLGVAAGTITREVFTEWVHAHIVRRGRRVPRRWANENPAACGRLGPRCRAEGPWPDDPTALRRHRLRHLPAGCRQPLHEQKCIERLGGDQARGPGWRDAGKCDPALAEDGHDVAAQRPTLGIVDDCRVDSSWTTTGSEPCPWG